MILLFFLKKMSLIFRFISTDLLLHLSTTYLLLILHTHTQTHISEDRKGEHITFIGMFFFETIFETWFFCSINLLNVHCVHVSMDIQVTSNFLLFFFFCEKMTNLYVSAVSELFFFFFRCKKQRRESSNHWTSSNEQNKKEKRKKCQNSNEIQFLLWTVSKIKIKNKRKLIQLAIQLVK